MKYVNKSLERSIALMNLFEDKSSKLTASEIADELGTSPGALYPIIHTLMRHGYLMRDKKKNFSLGLEFLSKANFVLRTQHLRTMTEPLLEDLAERFKGTAHLAVLQNGEVLYLGRVEGDGDHSDGKMVGYKATAYERTLGRVLLAYLPTEDLDNYFVETLSKAPEGAEPVSKEELRQDLDDIVKKGYALNRGKLGKTLTCVGGPVRDSEGEVVAAIGFSLDETECAEDFISQITSGIRETGLQVSKKLGYSP